MPRTPFAFSAYQNRSLPVSAQRLINVYAEKQPQGAKGELILLPTPGLEAFTTAGSGPIRGMIELAGLLIVVSGTDVYRVSVDGVATNIGSVENGDTVSLAENGAQVLIVVPESGRGYIATTSDVTLITDVDFPVATSAAFIDGYFVVTEANSGNFHVSAIDDGFTWNGDVANAERSPDNLTRALRVGSVLWLIGDKTSEIWSNQGASDFPFLQVSGAFIERGTAARFSAAQRLGTLFWLGDDRVVYRSDNFSPQRISNHAIEQAIAGYTTVSDAIGSIYEQEGHVFYLLSFPTQGVTWVYDASQGFWHERESEGYTGYRCHHFANYAGAAVGADSVNGALYTLSPLANTDAGTTIIRTAIGYPYHGESRRVFYSQIVAEFERGASSYASTDTAAIDGNVWLTVSDDGGRTWGTERWRSLGYQGDYRGRVVWHRLGSARERVFRLQWSDPVRTVLIAAVLDYEIGAH